MWHFIWRIYIQFGHFIAIRFQSQIRFRCRLISCAFNCVHLTCLMSINYVTFTFDISNVIEIGFKRVWHNYMNTTYVKCHKCQNMTTKTCDVNWQCVTWINVNSSIVVPILCYIYIVDMCLLTESLIFIIWLLTMQLNPL